MTTAPINQLINRKLLTQFHRKWDAHFLPQWKTAGVYKYADDGELFVGHFSKYHMGDVVKEVLLGLNEYETHVH